ncbi:MULTISPECIES: DNA primase catalytic core, N-terminal domain protein [Xenorhabdus]|uniref:DNA primase catalytic core, N-terminal domain protein n=1 Tax=Xenorhabdus TaxID=626 RepID=UPI000649B321|nr:MULTISPECIES: DNA primase catalytic core, N-terminal domain protein [Xenorhabdus]KLU17171.1 DNA primase catalytic core, N-terminal domain protein [Xenorhabdus griffiniae]KOP32754.1 DNA primase catalytic core, N-terminal domain protein [Xenorhabdus sp. GDc328]
MSANSNFREKLNEFDFEQFLDLEGISYRRTTGKNGLELNIRECPTCGSYDWKVYFNPKTKVGVCFAGSHPQDEQFNLYRFLQKHSGLARRELHAYIDTQLLEQGWRPKEKEIALESKVELKEEVQLPPHYLLPLPDGRIPDYLAQRNIFSELIRYFDLRFIVNGSHVYHDYSGRISMQDFSMRILIPIYDLTGKLSTFQGRDVTNTSDKKYLFPSTLPASGRFLYNGHNAMGKSTVVILEGVFDVFAVKRALFSDESLRDYVEPIGTFGMHLSGALSEEGQDQLGSFLTLKETGLKNVIFLWDSEKQAVKNTIKAAKKLQSIGLNVKIAAFTREGQDAGESDDDEILQAYFCSKFFNHQLALEMSIKGHNAIRSY